MTKTQKRRKIKKGGTPPEQTNNTNIVEVNESKSEKSVDIFLGGEYDPVGGPNGEINKKIQELKKSGIFNTWSIALSNTIRAAVAGDVGKRGLEYRLREYLLKKLNDDLMEGPPFIESPHIWKNISPYDNLIITDEKISKPSLGISYSGKFYYDDWVGDTLSYEKVYDKHAGYNDGNDSLVNVGELRFNRKYWLFTHGLPDAFYTGDEKYIDPKIIEEYNKQIEEYNSSKTTARENAKAISNLKKQDWEKNSRGGKTHKKYIKGKRVKITSKSQKRRRNRRN